jgi:signal transduction histidine kinase/CheY-like chemotaxis protein
LSWLPNMKLRTTIMVVFVAGFLFPAIITCLLAIYHQRQVLTAELSQEHTRTVQALALGLKEPVLTLIPETGEQLVKAVMTNKRILRVQVDSEKGVFIRRNREKAPDGPIQTIKSAIIHHGKRIGEVTVDIDMNLMQAILTRQSNRYFYSFLGLFLFSAVVLFWVLNYKIFKPLNRLLRQVQDLAQKKLDQEFRWTRKDEMGILGRSLDHMRRSLAALFFEIKQGKAHALGQAAELKKINANLETEVAERHRAEAALIDLRKKFEEVIAQRTAELTKSNRKLKHEIQDRLQAESERKAFEIKLQCAEKIGALGTLTGRVAHELNNFLVGIVSYPELILMDIPKDSPIHSPLLTIQKAGEKAVVIVQDLLTLAHRNVVTTEAVDLSEIVLEYLNSPEYRKLLESHPGVDVNTEFDTGGLKLTGSRVHITKTVKNLVSNAAQTIPETGVIRISIHHGPNHSAMTNIQQSRPRPEEEFLILKVSDTGSGIRPKDLEHLFEPFYTTKVMGQSGSGLEMAVVLGTVNDHNGRIDIQSEVGHGTEVTIYFPTAHHNKSSDYKETPKSAEPENETILVVDDMAEQRTITVRMLERMGFNAISVESGEAALELMTKRRFDLLILDMIMEPGIDGLETFRRCLRLNPDQRAVIASGYSQTDQIKKVQQLGHCYYIKKPFLLNTLKQVVREALDIP